MGLPRRYPLAPKRSGFRRSTAVVNLAGRGTGSAAQSVAVTLYLSTAPPNYLAAVGASSGVATVAAVGASVCEAAGASSGTSTLSGAGAATAATAGAVAAASTASAVGSTATTVVAGAGASSGTSSVAASGAPVAASDGASAGLASAAGAGASTAAADASCAGSATVAAVGLAVTVVEAAGASAGIATASAVGSFLATLEGVGSVAGTSSALASGIGIGTIPLVGASAGSSAASAVSAAVVVRSSALATRGYVWDYVAQTQAPIRVACVGSAAFGAPVVVGSVYLAGSVQLGASSRARVGSSGAMSVRVDLVPVGGAALASFAATLPSASFADSVVMSAVYLPAGWYDIELHAVTAGTAYFRGLHLAA